MNEPAGFTLNSAGEVVDVDPLAVIFNKAMPLMAAHMVVAAYVVGGFLIASVYAFGMLRGRRDRYHRARLHHPVHASPRSPSRSRWASGDSLARWVYNNEPKKFAAIELVPKTASDVPETLLGHLNSDGTVKGGIPIPGLASFLSDPATGTSTVVQGLDTVPADEQPTVAQVNTVHLAWDVMVGLGTLLFLLSLWYGVSWIFRRDMPKSRWFLRVAAVAGVAAVITMEAGWVVTEVGRQPWIVYNHMKVEDAATGNTGVWMTFVARAVLYIGVGVTTVLVLRGMSRRFRERGVDETDVPYGPAARSLPSGTGAGGGGGRDEHDAVAVVLFFGVTAYALFGGADFGAGFWDLIAGGAGPRRAAARADRPLDRPGLGGQPRLADLLPRRAVDRVLRGARVDHAHAVRAAHDSPRSAS